MCFGPWRVVSSSNLWNSTGEHLSLSPNGLSPGVHNYNATAIDARGNTASDIVVVIVDRVQAWWEASGTSITVTIGCLAVVVVVSGLICRSRKQHMPPEIVSLTTTDMRRGCQLITHTAPHSRSDKEYKHQ